MACWSTLCKFQMMINFDRMLFQFWKVYLIIQNLIHKCSKLVPLTLKWMMNFLIIDVRRNFRQLNVFFLNFNSSRRKSSKDTDFGVCILFFKWSHKKQSNGAKSGRPFHSTNPLSWKPVQNFLTVHTYFEMQNLRLVGILNRAHYLE